MQWQFWIIQTLNSVAFGGLLFLLSSGFSLIFGLMRIPNLAHGAFFMLGAYFGFTLLQLKLHFWLAALIGGLGVGLLGIVMERLVLRRLAGNERSQAFQLFGPFTRGLAEQEGGSNGRRPEAVRAAEQRHQRLAQLFRTEGLGREERKLPAVERLGLGALHVGLEATDPEQTGRGALAPPDRDSAGRNTGSNVQEFQAKIAHLGNLALGARFASGVFRRLLPLNTRMRERQTSRRGSREWPP
jgi:ABC-type branched-subunit amino acid transport system permease subunit